MKKIFLLLIVSTLVSCNNFDNNRKLAIAACDLGYTMALGSPSIKFKEYKKLLSKSREVCTDKINDTLR